MTPQHYQTLFENIATQLPGYSIESIQQHREAALAQFIQTGFPTKKNEMWRYTPLKLFLEHPFELSFSNVVPAEVDPSTSTVVPAKAGIQEKPLSLRASVGCEAIHEKAKGLLDCFSLQTTQASQRQNNTCIFVNGHCISTKKIPYVRSIRDCMQTHHPFLTHPTTPHAFTLLNDIFMQEGAWIEIPEGEDVTIHLLFLTTPEIDLQATYLRNFIVLHPHAKATIIETYLGENKKTYFTNTITKILLHEKSQLTHYKLQNESKHAFHFGTIEVDQQGIESQFHGHVISLGGLLSRSDTHAVLNATHSHCELNGLYRLSEKQHMDHDTAIDHQASHSISRQFYKGILDDESHGVFNGTIIVRQTAPKTDSKQSNQNLLLSRHAEIDTKPQLEIFADDVKCAHGATVGQLDENALFYLRSRGLDEPTARRLLITAFCNDILDRITDPHLKEYIQQCL